VILDIKYRTDWYSSRRETTCVAISQNVVCAQPAASPCQLSAGSFNLELHWDPPHAARYTRPAWHDCFV